MSDMAKALRLSAACACLEWAVSPGIARHLARQVGSNAEVDHAYMVKHYGPEIAAKWLSVKHAVQDYHRAVSPQEEFPA